MQMIYQLDDPYDIDGWKKAFDAFDNRFDELIAQVTEHIPRQELLCLGGGPCRVCKECTRLRGEPCIHPDQAIASVETYGVEVNTYSRKCRSKI